MLPTIIDGPRPQSKSKRYYYVILRVETLKSTRYIYQHIMATKKRTTADAGLDARGLEDGTDDIDTSSVDDNFKPYSPCRRGSSSHLREFERKNDHTYLHIDALVDRMVGVKKDHDRAEKKELHSKLLSIIEEMASDVPIAKIDLTP